MQLSFEYDRRHTPAFPVLDLQVSGADLDHKRVVTGLIDTGSDATQLPLCH